MNNQDVFVLKFRQSPVKSLRCAPGIADGPVPPGVSGNQVADLRGDCVVVPVKVLRGTADEYERVRLAGQFGQRRDCIDDALRVQHGLWRLYVVVGGNDGAIYPVK